MAEVRADGVHVCAIRPTSGDVRFRGQDISGLPMHRTARMGLVRTFQHSTLFTELSVLENALVGTHMAHYPSIWSAILGTDRAARREARAMAEQALEFFGLEGQADSRAGDLSHGHQRALGMAIALASRPEMVLLDEPFTGMNPEETRAMMTLMRKVNESGVTVLLVEHDMHAIMGLCHRITCMNFGRLLAEGTASEIRSHPDVIAAYLGGTRHAA